MERILVIAAMDVEYHAILATGEFRSANSRGMAMDGLTTAASRIFAVRSGVGLVNAGIATAFVIEEMAPTAVYLLGVGGALTERLNPGDLVIPDRIIQHDSFISGPSNVDLMAPGELFLSVPDDRRASPEFLTDPRLKERITRLFGKSTESILPGTMVSGSEFVGSFGRKKVLAEKHSAILVDMEAAAVALQEV